MRRGRLVVVARVPVARRMVTADPKRFTVSLFGVGAAIGLVLLLQGMWTGQLVQITAYEDRVGADLFVAEPDTESLLGDTSLVPLAVVEQIRRLSVVERADPVHLHATVSELHGSKEFVFIAGSAPNGLGGPWQLVAGRPARTDGEAVVDSILADDHGLEIGDTFEIKGRQFEVVGLSQETRSWMAAFIFITDREAGLLTGNPETVSYILVQSEQPTRAAAEIEEATGLAALDPEFLAVNDRETLAGILESPVRLMILIAFAAGTLVIALTVYSGLVERFREYGILKAMGASGVNVLGMVLGQTAVLAVAGSGVGYVMYFGGAWLVERVRPQFWFALDPGDVLIVLAGSLLMAAVAAVIPARQVARLDPASVYRGW
ncbi:MAG TPA: FtsX-like permease family protein [Acidimicrobiia bacterium]|nr:FtsX-like permease family protein [Acidimicrobiia bacterium]